MSSPRRRVTARDQQFLEWDTQQYALPIDMMARWYGSGRSWTYELAEKLERLGKVERVYATETGPKTAAELGQLGREGGPGRVPKSMWGPMWIVPTRATVHSFLGGSDPGPWTVRPSTAAHVRAVAELRLALTGRDTSPNVWRSERLLRRDAAAGVEIGGPHPYCHDALFRDDSGKVWAVECELSLKKGTGRMESVLMTSISAARNLTDPLGGERVSGVIYFCRGADVANHVTRAKENLRAEHGDLAKTIHIRDLDTILEKRQVAA
ncbi:hypothetical protein AB0M12_41760 [Nocardia vinacea]|uniref:hypothetical protein n=1 Tax=Nocardia vinacea TaxID=96468 RepID=UPI0034477F0B